MTKYIDVDVMLERAHDPDLAWEYDLRDLDRFIADVPIADVVPKAEFDALDAECSRLERLEEKYCFGRPKAIQEMVEKLKKRLPVISPCIFDNIAKEVLEEQRDVAPMAEIDDWQAIAEGYQKMFEDSYERHQAELAKTRAEVDQLKAIIDRLEQEKAEMLISETAEFRIPMEIAYRVRTEHPIFKAIKSEVAREIFADLEQYGICEQLCMGGVCLTEQEFEELKKKYGVE